MGDRYTITDRVDQGGMAEVFRGVAESLQGFKKSVAIKRILPNLTKNKKFVSMFLDEARLSLHLQHANIVHVFDIGVSDTTYFIVMEYVDGCALKAILESYKKAGQRLPVACTLYILMEVLKGLAYAHDAVNPMTNQALGIVHRDISPPNILISRNGEVKLVNFGLAKASSQVEITDPGVVKGKFSYLSPEAANGTEVDGRADLFAVGILLWEMLTGRRLFFGENDYQTVELIRQARVPAIAPLNPEVEPDLESVCRKALARDANDRYTCAADFGDALAQVLFSRGMKVTSRDIQNIVRSVVSERDKAKTKAPKQSLIDTLIQEEMIKFTSIDEEEERRQKQQSLTEGGQALDPGSFIDTRDWMDDMKSAAVPTARPVEKPLPPAKPAETSPRPVPAPEIGSLEQILEPEKPAAPARPARSSGFPVGLLVVAIVLAVVIAGALVLFRDRIFGDQPAPPASSEPR